MACFCGFLSNPKTFLAWFMLFSVVAQFGLTPSPRQTGRGLG